MVAPELLFCWMPPEPIVSVWPLLLETEKTFPLPKVRRLIDAFTSRSGSVWVAVEESVTLPVPFAGGAPTAPALLVQFAAVDQRVSARPPLVHWKTVCAGAWAVARNAKPAQPVWRRAVEIVR